MDDTRTWRERAEASEGELGSLRERVIEWLVNNAGEYTQIDAEDLASDFGVDLPSKRFTFAGNFSLTMKGWMGLVDDDDRSHEVLTRQALDGLDEGVIADTIQTHSSDAEFFDNDVEDNETSVAVGGVTVKVVEVDTETDSDGAHITFQITGKFIGSAFLTDRSSDLSTSWLASSIAESEVDLSGDFDLEDVETIGSSWYFDMVEVD